MRTTGTARSQVAGPYKAQSVTLPATNTLPATAACPTSHKCVYFYPRGTAVATTVAVQSRSEAGSTPCTWKD